MFAFVGEGDFPINQAVQFGDEVETGDKKGGELRVFFALQGAEEVIEVGHYLRTAGEKATVGVEGGGLFIKVTGADIGVAGYFSPFSPRRRIRATLACTFRPGMLYII